MGLRDALHGKRVYFDTMVFIYLIEGYAELRDGLLEIRDSLLNAECVAFTSELTLCETLVVPFRQNNAEAVAAYRQFIEDSGAFELRATTRETYVRASLYRAQFGLKTPDAIHVASAIEAGCDVFLTNNKPLKTPQGMQVVLMRGM